MGNDKKKRQVPIPRDEAAAFSFAEPVLPSATDRLTFDGYTLRWHGSSTASWDTFSGPLDESAKESQKETDDLPGGPIPQGLFAIEPSQIQEIEDPDLWDDWGKHRVLCVPYRATSDRMKKCFGVANIRTQMYVHGGTDKGTNGCIELNKDADETAFFAKLRAYGKRIELEVKYVGDRKAKYEDPRCPYNP